MYIPTSKPNTQIHLPFLRKADVIAQAIYNKRWEHLTEQQKRYIAHNFYNKHFLNALVEKEGLSMRDERILFPSKQVDENISNLRHGKTITLGGY